MLEQPSNEPEWPREMRTWEENVLSQHDFNSMKSETLKKLKIAGKHAFLDEKYLRANRAIFVTKEPKKTIKTRSKLRNESLKRKTESYWSGY